MGSVVSACDRRLPVATSDLAVKILAARCGFGNPVRMNRAFIRQFGPGPREYRMLHG